MLADSSVLATSFAQLANRIALADRCDSLAAQKELEEARAENAEYKRQLEEQKAVNARLMQNQAAESSPAPSSPCNIVDGE